MLIVEDDPRLGASLVRVMRGENHAVELCPTGAAGAERARAGGVDVIVLDWMLPDTDGLALCEGLRKAGCSTPILMLTVKSDVSDRVAGLRSGADDYLCKPFEVEELLARIDALARRSLQKVLSVGELMIDRGKGRVTLRGAKVDLTTREGGLLACLAARAGEPVSRAELLAEVWSLSFDPGTTVVEVHMCRLREKLGAYASAIETVRGRGYRLNTDFKL
ncbi:response regulator receiver [Labilithrix luteola]|uniref:Response regulator receiver n=1 Tax=Labilithrix luteola TaxID=1391654 RepID=A0A0K1PUC3_9BACT|nr:response regulator receiver [Labilithrix luteola]